TAPPSVSSVVERGFTRRLRNGKTFSQVALPNICFQELAIPVVERDDRVWEEAGEEGEDLEEEGVRLAGDWSAQEDGSTRASLSAVKLEDIPLDSSPKKRPLEEEVQPARKQSRTNAKRARRRHGNFDGYEIRVQTNPRPHSEPVATVVAPESLPAKADACLAKNVTFDGEFKKFSKIYTLEELRQMGFRVIGWDGR
ncbi:hypothetical protein V5O48_018954, partial [Marasmius crinis-equi]